MTILIDTYLTRSNILHETAKAYLFEVPRSAVAAASREVWMPKGKVEWIAHDPFAETAHVPAWLARKIPG